MVVKPVVLLVVLDCQSNEYDPLLPIGIEALITDGLPEPLKDETDGGVIVLLDNGIFTVIGELKTLTPALGTYSAVSRLLRLLKSEGLTSRTFTRSRVFLPLKAED
jgi:hypothetical protein